MREELEARGVAAEEVEDRVRKLEKRLAEKLSKGRYSLEAMQDTHALTKKKEQQQKRMDEAFGVRDYKPGSAFDFET